MGKISTPQLLKLLFKESDKEALVESYESYVDYNEEAQTLYKFLFERYFSPYPIKQTPDFFDGLKDKNNDRINEDLFKPSTLRNIYYPDGKRKRKRVLVFLYNFFEVEHIKRLAKDEKYAVTYAEQDIDSTFEAENNAEDKDCTEVSVNEITKELINNNAEPVVNLRGAILLNKSFQTEIAHSSKCDPVSFYMAKQDNNCQWFGVIADWDLIRDFHSKMKSQIVESFQWECKVATVVCGVGGTGKSTVLRRLAIDFIETEFIVIWINDLDYFFNSDLQVISEYPNNKFLLFIDEWHAIANHELAILFFKRISNSTNFRLVISDRDISKKIYLKYLFDENIYRLTSTDNKIIINKVLTIYPDWVKQANSILSRKEIYNASLLVILFILASTSQETATQAKRDLAPRFKELIFNDLGLMRADSSGVAKALSVYAVMYNRFKCDITWQTFKKMAVDLDDDQVDMFEPLESFDMEDPYCRFLSRYISAERLVHPLFSHTYVIKFHHDLLIESIIAQSALNGYGSKFLLVIFLGFCLKSGELSVATDLYNKLFSENLYTKDIVIETNNLPLPHKESFSVELKRNALLELLYNYAPLKSNDEFWKKNVSVVLEIFEYNKTLYKEIFSTILGKGCKSKTVEDAYQLSLNDDGIAVLERDYKIVDK